MTYSEAESPCVPISIGFMSVSGAGARRSMKGLFSRLSPVVVGAGVGGSSLPSEFTASGGSCCLDEVLASGSGGTRSEGFADRGERLSGSGSNFRLSDSCSWIFCSCSCVGVCTDSGIAPNVDPFSKTEVSRTSGVEGARLISGFGPESKAPISFPSGEVTNGAGRASSGACSDGNEASGVGASSRTGVCEISGFNSECSVETISGSRTAGACDFISLWGSVSSGWIGVGGYKTSGFKTESDVSASAVSGSSAEIGRSGWLWTFSGDVGISGTGLIVAGGGRLVSGFSSELEASRRSGSSFCGGAGAGCGSAATGGVCWGVILDSGICISGWIGFRSELDASVSILLLGCCGEIGSDVSGTGTGDSGRIGAEGGIWISGFEAASMKLSVSPKIVAWISGEAGADPSAGTLADCSSGISGATAPGTTCDCGISGLSWMFPVLSSFPASFSWGESRAGFGASAAALSCGVIGIGETGSVRGDRTVSGFNSELDPSGSTVLAGCSGIVGLGSGSTTVAGICSGVDWASGIEASGMTGAGISGFEAMSGILASPLLGSLSCEEGRAGALSGTVAGGFSGTGASGSISGFAAELGAPLCSWISSLSSTGAVGTGSGAAGWLGSAEFSGRVGGGGGISGFDGEPDSSLLSSFAGTCGTGGRAGPPSSCASFASSKDGTGSGVGLSATVVTLVGETEDEPSGSGVVVFNLSLSDWGEAAGPGTSAVTGISPEGAPGTSIAGTSLSAPAPGLGVTGSVELMQNRVRPNLHCSKIRRKNVRV